MRRGIILSLFLPILLAGAVSPSMQEYNRAWQLAGQGKPDEALSILRQVLLDDPAFYRAYWAVLAAFAQKADLADATRFFDDIASTQPKRDPHLLAGKIGVYFNFGSSNEGFQLLQDCISQLPDWVGCNANGGFSSYPESFRARLKNLALTNPANRAVRFGLAQIEMAHHRNVEALAIYRSLLNQSQDDRDLQLLLLERMANINTGSATDSPRRQQIYQEALKLSIEAGDPEKEITFLSCLMDISFRAGDRDGAGRYLKGALDRARQLDNPHAIAEVYGGWGMLHREQGNSDEAIQAYLQMLPILQSQNRSREIASVLRQLADVEARRGDYQSALSHLEEAEPAFQDYTERVDLAFIQRSEGEIHVELGEYDKAIALHLRAFQSFQSAGNLSSSGGELGDLGIAYERLGDETRAEASYNRSLVIARQCADVPEQERILTLLADLKTRQGHYTEAAVFLNRSLTLSTFASAPRFRAKTLLLLGRVEGRLGKFAEALLHLRAGIDAAKSLKSTELDFLGAYCLGEILAKSGNPTQATLTFQYALRLAESARVPDAIRMAHEALGSLDERTGHLQEAVAHFRAAIEATEGIRAHLGNSEFKTIFLSDKIDVYQRLISVLVTLNRPRDALFIAEKARARTFLDKFTVAHLSDNSSLTELGPLDAAAIEAGMARRSQILIEYSLGDKRSFVWVVTGNRTRMAQLPGRDFIERQARRFHQLLATRSPETGQEALSLYKLLIAPVASELSPSYPLIIVPDGALHYLPFECLRPAPDHFLGETFSVAYAPSASVLDPLSRPGNSIPRKALLAFGDPDFGSAPPSPGTPNAVLRGLDTKHGLHLVPLPNTRTEVRDIAALYPGANKTYVGSAASKSSLRLEKLDDYAHIHFATHAFIDEAKPERSGIVLTTSSQSDGILRVHEILSLKLNADLVVLSACQTGLGKMIRGEGMDGLTRAFLFAGARRVVASLWDVNDVATAQLMTSLYRHMQTGLNPARALQAAKIEMLHSGITAYRDPYFWAAFVLIGEP